MVRMSKTSKIQCIECNTVNGTHVEEVKDIKIHVLFVICSHSYSSQRPQAGSTGVSTIREDMYRGRCGGAASTAAVCQDTYNTHPG